ncbi:MAG: hypothetical protein B7X30_13810 [Thiomonas sp. 13-64-67]|jgi:purine-binding chemotaxis protein CheW|nr:MAG: hypothetical protein B7X30_13810 [Thiomonas sp. 13-64-67]
MMETQGQQDAQLIGVLVDAVNAVLELEAAEIEPSPKFGAAVHSDFILGMAKLDKVGFVTLLDPGRVFSSEEMAALAQAEKPRQIEWSAPSSEISHVRPVASDEGVSTDLLKFSPNVPIFKRRDASFRITALAGNGRDRWITWTTQC